MPSDSTTAAPLPPLDLVGLIRYACTAHADRVAIRAQDGERTFAELAAVAGALAADLRGRGVRPGDVVGLWGAKSVDLLAGVVGILAAGGAYLPLDPGLPAERLAYLVADAGPRFVVAAARDAAEAGALEVTVVTVGAGPGVPGADFPDCDLNPLAYVIYTSGSTGRPKGVVVERPGVVSLLLTMADDLRLKAGDVLVGTAPAAFDASVPNLLLPLVTGGTLCLPPPEVAVDPIAVAALVDEVHADVLKCSNSVLRMLCDIDWPGRPDLKVVTGGESLPPAVATQLLPRVAELWNYYGPTETTVSSLRARVVAGDTDPVPIGWPMPGVGHLVVGDDLRPVTTGSVGELWLSGPGVARGYLNDEARTAERFIELPDRAGRPTRGYRTGDRVRQRPDGALLMLGRTDDQVKLNGYRIELAEVESRLAEHPDVLQAVVVVNRRHRGHGRLVAFVHLGRSDVTPDELRRFAGRLLPAYMVPANVIVVDAFPLTVGGKIDRAALAVSPLRETPVDTGSVGDPLERQVADLMASVLGLAPEEMRPTDNFFALGGRSILAVELVGALRRQLRVRLPLSVLVTSPTIADLARAVTAARIGQEPQPLVRLRDGVGVPIFCIHDGTGDLLSFRELTEALPADQAVYGLQMVGVDRSHRLPFDLAGIVTRYLAEVRSVWPDGPYVFLGYSFGGLIAYLMAARMAEEGHATPLVALLDTAPPRQVLRLRRPMPRDPAGLPPGWRGVARQLGLRIRDAGDRVRYRSWRLVAMPLWVRRGRVLPGVVHDPARVLLSALRDFGDFPAYDGRVIQWWGNHLDNVPIDVMVTAWDTVVRRGIDLRVIAGPEVAHVDFLAGPRTRVIVEQLTAELDQATAWSVRPGDRGRRATGGAQL